MELKLNKKINFELNIYSRINLLDFKNIFVYMRLQNAIPSVNISCMRTWVSMGMMVSPMESDDPGDRLSGSLSK